MPQEKKEKGPKRGSGQGTTLGERGHLFLAKDKAKRSIKVRAEARAKNDDRGLHKIADRLLSEAMAHNREVRQSKKRRTRPARKDR